ncbi:polyhydroxyalkanoate synthase [Altererythrobacter atlanticus]|uniref:Poly-beta-hydroxybutyrate polymerase n=2 Tax=Croceibacterium atlanticum TaxID=1267766 RepID=A0A0F7KWU1_9SPHN|nr:poly-beta-hydroxybutyrate polymerase N-terminal domain-containing protein [Croceibacterium atlanticum]AKH43692.1 Poly-beta-hydroxybutyrate polymerase [Croceibacterium atlanticum]MBB5733824.1 polyhydroxyalkanoate synthase [Croceibacterium atlanticum]
MSQNPVPQPASSRGDDLAAPDPVEGVAELIDRATSASLAQWTLGIAPESLAAAFADWAVHAARSPGRAMLLATKTERKLNRLADYAVRAASGGGQAERCIEPLPQDHRFTDPAWDQWPFGLYQQAFLLTQQWLDVAFGGLPGVTPHHDEVVRFTVRQLLDLISPANFVWSNPVVQQRVLATGGMCLVEGARLFAEDWQSLIRREPIGDGGDFEVGRNLAVTPGKVVYRNELIELIQYSPTTDKVRPEPILFVPAWIMKYHILASGAISMLKRKSIFRFIGFRWRFEQSPSNHRN